MNKLVKVGIIGLGPRTETLLGSFVNIKDVEVVAVCDLLEDRIKKIVGILERNEKPTPKTFTNYHELLADADVEAVFVPTSWNSHLQIAVDCMNAGKYVGIEVGGAASIDELWQLLFVESLWC